jgi:hypothetical protein
LHYNLEKEIPNANAVLVFVRTQFNPCIFIISAGNFTGLSLRVERRGIEESSRQLRKFEFEKGEKWL